jgi:ABC-type branched-subunit amino acid transport system substrate-binding protein
MPQWFSQHIWRWLLAAALVSLLGLAIACGDDDDDDDDGGATSAPAQTSAPAGETTAPAGEAVCEGGPGVTGDGEPLKIGLLVSYTGALASFGPEHENAAKLAAKCINDAGGVNGGEVEIITGDDGTSADVAVTSATQLVEVEGVAAIVGALGSSVSLAVAESVTGPSQILQISPASTSPSLTDAADDDFLFRTPISDAAQGVVLANLISEDLGLTSVCTMYVNNAYGRGLNDNFVAAFEGSGGAVTAEVSHDDAQAVSYASQLQTCTEGDPEALVAISYPVGQATVYLREAIEGGLADTFVFVDGTKDDEMFAELGWAEFDGMKGTAPGALDSDYGDAFDTAYEEEYGQPYQVAFVREAFDATVAIALAAAAAGSNTDSVAIRDALRDVANAPGDPYGPPAELPDALEAIAAGTDIDYQGASGSVDFDDAGDVTYGAIEVWHVNAAAEMLETEARFAVDLASGEVTPLD